MVSRGREGLAKEDCVGNAMRSRGLEGCGGGAQGGGMPLSIPI